MGALKRYTSTIFGATLLIYVVCVDSLLSVPNCRLLNTRQPCQIRLHAQTSRGPVGPIDENEDYYKEFSWFEKILFRRFADSVSMELGGTVESSASTYKELMSQINTMASSRPLPVVNEQGRNMLVRLFPGWLLPAFRVIFAQPFPTFSAWMNAWVTKWTTHWLMGPAEIIDLKFEDGSIGKDQLLVIEKCRFLESTGCAQTCLHTCKLPTQDFFLKDMAIPVTLRPNFTDYSCRFEFGMVPVPLIEDHDIVTQPCLSTCAHPKGGIGTKCVQ